MRDEKLHAVVAQSTFRSQNVHNTSTPEHFWKLRCGKRARRYGAKVREAHFEVNTCKTHQVRSTFGRWDVQKVHGVVARSTFRSQNLQTQQVQTTFGSWHVEKAHAVVAWSTFQSQKIKNTTCSDHFWTLERRLEWRAQGILHLVKSEQTWGFCGISKNDGRRGTFEEDLQRCTSRGRRSTIETCSSEMLGDQGRDFLRGVADR